MAPSGTRRRMDGPDRASRRRMCAAGALRSRTTSPRSTGSRKVEHPRGNRGVIVQWQDRAFGADRLIAGDRDDVRLVWPDRRLAERRPVYFELRERVALEPLDQHEIDRIQPAQQLGQARL